MKRLPGKPLTLYISGPMSGYPEHNFPLFKYAEKVLRQCGFEVLNPAAGGEKEGWDWQDYLRMDVQLVAQADGLAMLQNWELSKGACLEVYLAHQLNMPVLTLSHWHDMIDPNGEVPR